MYLSLAVGLSAYPRYWHFFFKITSDLASKKPFVYECETATLHH